MFIKTLRQIPFNTIIDNPMIAAVGINPNTRLQLAQVLSVKATIDRLILANSPMRIKQRSCKVAEL